MGSIDETDSAQPSCGGGTPHLQVQCDPGVPAELDLLSKGGSLVEFLCSGDLDLAAPSSSKLSQDYSPPYDLYRYRKYGVDGGEVIFLRSQQYCKCFLTGHTTTVSPNEWLVDARATFSSDSDEWPTVASYWRPLTYEKAFRGATFYNESLASKNHFVLQHWPWAAQQWPQSALNPKNGKYFVIEYDHFTHKWKYYLGSWIVAFNHGVFMF